MLLMDLRYALRTIVNRPSFSIIIVFTLALGIAVNSSLFSMVEALILRPFPIPGINSLVQLWETVPKRGVDRSSLAPANYLDVKNQNQVFDSLCAYYWWDVNVTGGDQPERVQGTLATPGCLKMLGVETVLGRTLSEEESGPEWQRTVVLSYQLWARRFGSDPGIVGSSVLLNGERYDVIGVAEAGFNYPYGSEMWAPLILDPEESSVRDGYYLEVIGRLKVNTTLERTRAELDTIASRLAQEYPLTNEGRSLRALELSKAVVDIGLPAFLTVWQGGVLLVLVIACVNVANLLLVRGADRRKELSIRFALGANRWRIMRQMLTESLVLAVSGALLSLPLTWYSIELIRNGLPPNIMRFVVGWSQMGLDWQAISFTMGIAVVSTLLFGLMPALTSSRLNLNLSQGSRGDSGAVGHQRGRSFLVTAEVTMALVLLVAAGLCIQGTIRMIESDQGYRPEGLMTMSITLSENEYDTEEKQLRFYEDSLVEVRSLPNVIAAEAVNVLPSSGRNTTRAMEIEGQSIANLNERPFVHYRPMTEGYFQTMSIPLLSGRAFTHVDRKETLPVAIVSRQLAETYWPNSSPLGKRLRLGREDDGPWLTIIGTAGDVMHDWFLGGVRPTLYVPLAQSPRRGMDLAIRTQGRPEDITSSVRAAIQRIDPNQPIYNVRSMQKLLSERMIGLRYISVIMGVLGSIALVLAVVGIYGLMAYSVSRRTREIGVRMALGADNWDVIRLAVGSALKMTLIGITIGLVLSWGVGNLMESALFGVVSLELSSVLVFALVLAFASLVASTIPARRALRVDPAQALRFD